MKVTTEERCFRDELTVRELVAKVAPGDPMTELVAIDCQDEMSSRGRLVVAEAVNTWLVPKRVNCRFMGPADPVVDAHLKSYTFIIDLIKLG
jgi:hypothetical protein